MESLNLFHKFTKITIRLKIIRIIVIIIICFPLVLFGQDNLSKKEQRNQKKNFLLSGKKWTVEIPLCLPGYAGSLATGDVDIEGDDDVDIENPIEPPPPIFDFEKLFSRLFTTNWYLKFFFLTKIAYENNRYLGQFDAFAGGVGESTEFNFNRKEIVQVNFQAIE